jgi:hypothetical protein
MATRSRCEVCLHTRLKSDRGTGRIAHSAIIKYHTGSTVAKQEPADYLQVSGIEFGKVRLHRSVSRTTDALSRVTTGFTPNLAR